MRSLGSPTFTMRTRRIGKGYAIPSEVHKTLEAIRNGAITGAYQIHAYMNADDDSATNVVAWGIAHRVQLFQWAQERMQISATEDKQRQQKQEFGHVCFNEIPNDILIRYTN